MRNNDTYVPGDFRLPETNETREAVINLRTSTLMFYGKTGVGKSILAAGFDDLLYLDITGGADFLGVQTEKINDWRQFMEIVTAVRASNKHWTVVIDTIQGYYDLCLKNICRIKHKPLESTEDVFGSKWGAGYALVRPGFKHGLQELCSIPGIGVIMLAHERMSPDEKRYEPLITGQCRLIACGFCGGVYRIDNYSMPVDEKQGSTVVTTRHLLHTKTGSIGDEKHYCVDRTNLLPHEIELTHPDANVPTREISAHAYEQLRKAFAQAYMRSKQAEPKADTTTDTTLQQIDAAETAGPPSQSTPRRPEPTPPTQPKQAPTVDPASILTAAINGGVGNLNQIEAAAEDRPGTIGPIDDPADETPWDGVPGPILADPPKTPSEPRDGLQAEKTTPNPSLPPKVLSRPSPGYRGIDTLDVEVELKDRDYEMKRGGSGWPIVYEDLDFGRFVFPGVTLRGITFRRCRLVDADISQADTTGAVFEECEFGLLDEGSRAPKRPRRNS